MAAQPIFAQQLPQEEEKKVVAAQEEVSQVKRYSSQPTQTTQQTQVPAAPNVMTYLQLHGKAAAQRVRNFITAPSTIGAIPSALSSIAAGIILNTLPGFLEEMSRLGYTPANLFCLGAASSLILCAPNIIHSISDCVASERFEDAIVNNDSGKVRYLLAAQLLDLNPPYLTFIPLVPPLFMAAKYRRPEIFKLLLEHGARLDTKSETGGTIQDALKITPHDTQATQQAKQAMQKIVLEYTLQETRPLAREQVQKKLRAQYEPVETIAAQAIEELHISMYGKSGLGQVKNITDIIGSYLTPEYVELPRKKYPTIPLAHPVESSEKIEHEKKKNA